MALKMRLREPSKGQKVLTNWPGINFRQVLLFDIETATADTCECLGSFWAKGFILRNEAL